MRASDHDRIIELLGAYSLDALEKDEATTVRDHLARCRTCSEEVAAHHTIAGMLGNSGDNAPAHLWHRISSGIEHPKDTGQGRPLKLVLARADVAKGSSRPLPSVSPSFKTVTLLASAAAVIAIAVLSIQVGRLDSRVGELQRADSRASLSRAADEALADPGARVVDLTSTNSTGAPVAKIVVVTDGESFLVNEHLASLPSTKTYQLWGFEGDEAVSLGLLGADPTDVPFRVDPGNHLDSFAVTVEAAGGVVKSTHAPVAVSVIS